MEENALTVEEKRKQELEKEKKEQKIRGQRIKYIRQQELCLTKTELGKKIGVSSQFLGLVEEGRGNLVYKSIKRLKEVSGHSADYILYGLDDDTIKETKKCLEVYSEKDLIQAIDTIKEIVLFLKNKDI